MKKLLVLILALSWILLMPTTTILAEEKTDEEKLEELKEELDDLEKRMKKTERHAGTDRVEFTGDYRFEAHSIAADIPEHFDGMALQGLVVDTLFYAGDTGGMFPMPGEGETVREFLDAYINDYDSPENWVHYQQYIENLNFDDLKEAMGSFPPEMQEQLMQMLLPETYRAASDADNSILYTNRLRLRMKARVARNVTFDGRLAAYKVFGDSTGVQVFNGQPNSINFDGTTASVPNSDIVRVERAYFNWTDIGGVPFYISIGRRPSTSGVPGQFRQDEVRGGSPLGAVIDFQFDGITLGGHINEKSTIRLCYGLGYESGFGNGLEAGASLEDAHFLGLNWDIYHTERTFLQTTVAKAFDVTDGFNGLVVLPVDPLTGQDVPAPVVMRYTPSANLGDMYLASLVFVRKDGPFDWFVSANYSKSDPLNVTTPFGGMFSDPFGVPEKEDGSMYWVGGRYRFNEDKTKVGLEFNTGSEYWFNFALAQDDIVGAKTSTRGDVWEAYITHRIHKKFSAKLSYIDYTFDYSGSGWLMGAPKDLDNTPILGFPTYDSAQKIAFAMMARW